MRHAAPSAALHTPLRLLSHVVLLLMLAALVYAAVISIRYWSGIGV